MIPNIYPLLNVPGVRAVAPDGVANVRLYSFGEAPADTPMPYGVWQFPSGTPLNQLAGVPQVDQVRVQIDIYGQTPAQSRQLALAVRNALEPSAHCFLYMDMGRDPDTDACRITASFDLWATRP